MRRHCPVRQTPRAALHSSSLTGISRNPNKSGAKQNERKAAADYALICDTTGRSYHNARLPPHIGQPWLLRPRISRFVTSPSRGYASRPNRAIDGKGTFTPLDSRLCRPLPQHYLCNLCVGAWSPTPPSSPGAIARYFPRDTGLTVSSEKFGTWNIYPAMQLQQSTTLEAADIR